LQHCYTILSSLRDSLALSSTAELPQILSILFIRIGIQINHMVIKNKTSTYD